MNTVEIKKSFHKLIDRIDNDTVLSKFYDLLERAAAGKDGHLWERLTTEEKQELLHIDTEADNNDNLIDV